MKFEPGPPPKIESTCQVEEPVPEPPNSPPPAAPPPPATPPLPASIYEDLTQVSFDENGQPLPTSARVTGANPRTVLVSLKNGRNPHKGAGIFFSMGTNSRNAGAWGIGAGVPWGCSLFHVWGHYVDICENGTPPGGGVTLPYDKWHHVGFTYDGTSIRFYYDGILASTESFSANTVDSEAYYGCYAPGPHGDCFKGTASQLRVFDIALDDEQVASFYSLPGPQ